jgi:predicted outer membrane protein
MRCFIAGGLACVLLVGSAASAQQATQSSPTPPAQSVAKMTNADVIELVGLSLSDEVVIDKI